MNIGGRILWSHLKVPGVTVSVSPAPKTYALVFQVDKMVDVTKNHRFATLKPFDLGYDQIVVEYEAGPMNKKQLSLPFKMGNLSLLYTAKTDSKLIDVEYFMKFGMDGRRFEKIVPDVLMAGDLLVVRQKPRGQGIQGVEVLRAISHQMRRKLEVMNAL